MLCNEYYPNLVIWIEWIHWDMLKSLPAWPRERQGSMVKCLAMRHGDNCSCLLILRWCNPLLLRGCGPELEEDRRGLDLKGRYLPNGTTNRTIKWNISWKLFVLSNHVVLLLSICKIFQLRLWRRPDGPGAGAVAERVRLPGVPPRHALHLPQHVQVDTGDPQLSCRLTCHQHTH